LVAVHWLVITKGAPTVAPPQAFIDSGVAPEVSLISSPFDHVQRHAEA
jgi:hypothetical protein